MVLDMILRNMLALKMKIQLTSIVNTKQLKRKSCNSYWCLGIKSRNENLKKELIDLNGFKRGVYSSKNLQIGAKLKKSQLKLSYSASQDQIKANDILTVKL